MTAVDPEDKGVTWKLTNDDATNSPDYMAFEIDGGRLTFDNPPDFEEPMDGTLNGPSRDNEYLVSIEATDTKVGGDVPTCG